MKNKEHLSLEQLLLFQSEMRHAEKSLALAYFMLIGGHLGVHRFYLRRFVSGSIQLALFLIAILGYYGFSVAFGLQEEEWTALSVCLVTIKAIAGAALFIWVVVDMCILPRMVRQWNAEREEEIIRKLTRQPY